MLAYLLIKITSFFSETDSEDSSSSFEFEVYSDELSQKSSFRGRSRGIEGICGAWDGTDSSDESEGEFSVEANKGERKPRSSPDLSRVESPRVRSGGKEVSGLNTHGNG